MKKRDESEPLPRPARPFHITVGTSSVKALDLETDLRMLRSALLYADQVRLCSITTSSVLMLASIWERGSERFLDWGDETIFEFLDETRQPAIRVAIEQYRAIFKKRHKNRDELTMLRMLERDFAQKRKEFRERNPAITKEEDIRGIQKAIRLKILELKSFKSLDMKEFGAKYLAEGDTVEFPIVEEFMDMVSSAIQDGTTYPLFDDTTGLLVKMGVDDGAISASTIRVQQARHSALAANLFERLPDFSATTLGEILDIRKELSDSLDRFRSGLSNYAREMRSAPWTKDFAAEADELFIREVKPGIFEIEELVESSNSLRAHVWREVKESKSLIGGGGVIGYFLDDYVTLSKYVTAALTGTVPLALSVWEGFTNWIRERRAIKAKTLYFYYRLRDKVERS
jgi:hypothetical protein